MVDGPMARNARDCALMLDAMAGAHPEDPLSIEAPARSFAHAVATLPPPGRIAYSPDLGLLPVDREVAAVCRQAADSLSSAGMEVAEACPDLSGALDVFQVLRAALFAADKGPLLETHRDALKPEIIWNIEKGLALDADTIARAERARGGHLPALRALLPAPRRAGLPLRDRAALRRGHALGRRDRRPPLRQLRRLAGPHLRADADRVSKRVGPGGLHRVRPARSASRSSVPRAARRQCCARQPPSRRRFPLAARTPIDPRGPDGAALAA